MKLRRILMVLLGLVLVAGGGMAFLVYRTFFSPNTAFESEEVFIYIPTGTEYPELRALVAPYLVDSDAFDAVARRKQYSDNIRPGKYPILKGMNNNEIVNALRSRNTPVRVSFNNQESPAALAGRVAQQIEADSGALLAAITHPDYLAENGWTEDQTLIPYIPNSYEFYWNTSAEAFRDRMVQEYRRFWTEERVGKARRQGLSPEEAISLAAIVQKETAKVDERPRVAGLYLNRIKQGIPLQADPTIIFAIKKETGNYDTIIKRVLYRDLELDSPYNTYKNKGVPPGPIFMPDISSVEAVLNPESHRYLYMVADTENFGYHLFAESLAQHNRNKVQYVRWLNANDIRR